MDWTELIGSLSGVLFVILAVRQNIWTFPVAIVSSLFYMVVFSRQTLYADATCRSCLSLWPRRVGIYGCGEVRTGTG